MSQSLRVDVKNGQGPAREHEEKMRLRGFTDIVVEKTERVLWDASDLNGSVDQPNGSEIWVVISRN